MEFNEEIVGLYEKCIEGIDPNETQIDFVDECHNAQKGELRSYPLDDTVIMSFQITEQEMNRYTGSQYAEHSWTAILEDILLKRLARVEGHERTSLFSRA